MRAITFRGKSVSNGDWIYGDLYQKKDWYIVDDISEDYVVVDAETVGQNTGLEVHCGDIEDIPSFLFEGDVCELTLFNPITGLDDTCLGTIEYLDGAFWFLSVYQEGIAIPLPNIEDIRYNLTILGNKYDHLESLKKMYP